MERISITDGNGSWFDRDRAELFEEELFWDGCFYISKATGCQSDHEFLYLTRSKQWVLHTWSAHQGASFSYFIIDSDAAARWFARQGYDEKLIPVNLRSIINSFEI